MEKFFLSPTGITLIVIMLLALLYLLFIIFNSKLLFKSAFKGIKNSLISITFLTFLYTVTFSLINSNLIYINRTTKAIDAMTSQSNYHQGTLRIDVTRNLIKESDPYHMDDLINGVQ
jgi:hypothetical protein